MRTIILQLLLVLVVFSTAAVADKLVLVVNKNNAVQALDENDIRQIYLGKKRTWDDGQKIVLYSLYDRTVTGEFTQQVLNKSAQQFVTYWKKALFTGTGRPPIEANSDDEMKKMIAADPRGIGFISKKSVDDSIKAIAIN